MSSYAQLFYNYSSFYNKLILCCWTEHW